MATLLLDHPVYFPAPPEAEEETGMSAPSQTRRLAWTKTAGLLFNASAVTYDRWLAHRFKTLAAKWEEETAFLSSPLQMAENEHYRAVVALGWPVVPLILRELQKAPNFWFEALHEITGAQPIPEEHAGDVETMAQDWVNWGLENGLL